MSLLARFKKKDGFENLLKVVENSGSKKRADLLKAIAVEDPNTAVMIRKKLLTIERIWSWEAAHLSELTTRLPDRIIAAALVDQPPEIYQKVAGTLPFNKMRMIESLVPTLQLSPSEKEAIYLQIIQKARELDRDRVISLRRIDPSLDITDIKVA